MAPGRQDITKFVIPFTPGDESDVVAAMERLCGSGSGWINIGPALTEEQQASIPAPSAVSAMFSARGPAVPMATWTPPDDRRRPTPTTIGIEHGAGSRVLEQLAGAGVELPPGWRKLQDHPKRGLVVQVPGVVAHTDVLAWLLAACRELCAVPIDDHWSAVVNELAPRAGG